VIWWGVAVGWGFVGGVRVGVGKVGWGFCFFGFLVVGEGGFFCVWWGWSLCVSGLGVGVLGGVGGGCAVGVGFVGV